MKKITARQIIAGLFRCSEKPWITGHAIICAVSRFKALYMLCGSLFVQVYKKPVRGQIWAYTGNYTEETARNRYSENVKRLNHSQRTGTPPHQLNTALFPEQATEQQRRTVRNFSEWFSAFLLLSVWIKILFSVHNTEAATQQALKPDAYSNHSGSRGECFCYDLPGKHLLSVSLCPVPSALIWCRIYSFTAWNE